MACRGATAGRAPRRLRRGSHEDRSAPREVSIRAPFDRGLGGGYKAGRRHPESRVKIYFCDICNESIPLQDLETGAAITVKGKVICRTCNPAGGTRMAAPAGGTGRAAAWAFLAFLAAAGGSIGYTRFRERAREQRLRGQADGVRGDLTRPLETLTKQVAAAEERAERSERRLGEVAQSFEEGSRLAEKEREEGRARFDRVQAYIRENEELKHRLERLEIRQSAFDEGIGRLTAALEGVRHEILASTAANVGTPPAGTQPAPATPEKREDGLAPTVQALVDKLKDADASV